MSDNETPVTGEQDIQVQTASIVVQPTPEQIREQPPKKPRKRAYDEDRYDIGGGG